MKIKIVNGFVWFVVTDKAKDVLKSNLFELYALYDDGSEGLVPDEKSLSKAIEDGLDIGIEVGFINS